MRFTNISLYEALIEIWKRSKEFNITDLSHMFMTMSCLRCGNMMIWLNGSISHRHDIQYYECKHCNIKVVKYPDDQIIEVEDGNRV
ncbi:hypothetical protein [Candidatus Nitrosocosmicus arcticus]|nr:hypothetical protein [Candidatus Nitrosocosmicus arcticus]